MNCTNFHIYSSEKGIWTSKKLHCPCYIPYQHPMSLNGTLYVLSQIDFELPDPGVLLAHDFYSESDEFLVIPLPDHSDQKYKRAFSTSGGFVMYIKTLGQEVGDVLKVWRLKNNEECWQHLWEIRLTFIPWSDIGYYAPMAMHPLDSNIVYVWSLTNRYLVACNLRTQTSSKCYGNDDHQDCFVNNSFIGEYMDLIHGSIWGYGAAVTLFQFVLPTWMESVPCPPKTEMIDTTSLYSHTATIRKRKRDNGE
ncbi:unnamed protein product [Eruca vesicaria subsp. sativa]|uniref:F-box protein At3g26010-like beta-propeller domain-containing protein n=1 Tax=Eruca vesicaria subsp. sativa TaxID=29727 RepID=A0ABC8K6H3_ERUVS|nr:unnamed protein product [Eruca vesicaria subsp. sativa]